MTDMALFELIVTCAGVILLAAGAAAGMILGRKAAFAGLLSGYGTPLALLLTLLNGAAIGRRIGRLTRCRR